VATEQKQRQRMPMLPMMMWMMLLLLTNPLMLPAEGNSALAQQLTVDS